MSRPSTPIVFRDPPPSTRRDRGSVADLVRDLGWHLGEWAVYRERVTSGSAHATASAYRRRFPNTEWRAACETPDEPDLRTIFVRVIYV